MEQKYSDMYPLLAHNKQAHHYYAGLPGYVQDEMNKKAARINSFSSLRDCAENLTRGDG